MYALRLPPELVSRLYRLREEFGQGSIRSQVVTAIERYVEETEKEYAVSHKHSSGEPASPASSP
jgi:predicted DNA-binding protein